MEDMISGSWIEDSHPDLRLESILQYTERISKRQTLRSNCVVFRVRRKFENYSRSVASHGLATVVNANGALAEFWICTGVWALDDDFEDDELTEALERLAQDYGLRKEIGAKAHDIAWNHAYRLVAAVPLFYQGYRRLLRQGCQRSGFHGASAISGAAADSRRRENVVPNA